MNGALFVFLLGVQISLPAENASYVWRATSEAYIKKTRIDKDIRNYVKKKVNKELYQGLGNALLVTKVIQEQKLSYTWEF